MGQEPGFCRVGIEIVIAGKEQEKLACVRIVRFFMRNGEVVLR